MNTIKTGLYRTRSPVQDGRNGRNGNYFVRVLGVTDVPIVMNQTVVYRHETTYKLHSMKDVDFVNRFYLVSKFEEKLWRLWKWLMRL